MQTSPLRDWVKAVPFVPFTVTMSSGRQVQVTSPEMIIPGRRWNTVAWVDEEGCDRFVIIPHDHINTVKASAPGEPPS
jgi:hypothetical protein